MNWIDHLFEAFGIENPKRLSILDLRVAQYKMAFGVDKDPIAQVERYDEETQSDLIHVAVQLGACGVIEFHALDYAKAIYHLQREVGHNDLKRAAFPFLWVFERGYAKQEDLHQIAQGIPQMQRHLRDMGLHPYPERMPSEFIGYWLSQQIRRFQE